jgi:DNA primase
LRSTIGTMAPNKIGKRKPLLAARPVRPATASVAGVHLSHPDRVYWRDAGISKRDLAEFYAGIWTWMRPHLAGRPIALLRCPEGASEQCFFQKHASAGIATEHLHLVAEKGNTIIAIDDLAGLISLVQAGVLEIHTRGTSIGDRERADRLVFDLDPGPGTGWSDVVAAAREVRERLDRLKLKSFVKTSGDQANDLGCGQRLRPRHCCCDGQKSTRPLHRHRHKEQTQQPHFHRLSAQQP